MNKIIVIVVILLSINACSSTEKKNNTESPAENALQVKEDIIIPSDSGIVNITLVNGEGNALIHKVKDQVVYIEFVADGYKEMTAKLSSPDSLANVRFSQIILPDGTMDGPFGREINYKTPVNGVYKLSVHENMMAGDPWEGDFRIGIKLSR